MRYRLKAIEVLTTTGRTTAVMHMLNGERKEFPVGFDASLVFEFGARGVLLEADVTSLEGITPEDRP